MRQLIQFLKNITFPLICPHCHELSSEKFPLLCKACVEQLELLSLSCRCKICFRKAPCETLKNRLICTSCASKKKNMSLPFIDAYAAAFEYQGAIKTLVREFKYQDRPYLAKSLSAFLYLQYEQLLDGPLWQKPDIITFIPQNFLKKLTRGYNASELLALELGKLTGIPTQSLLVKKEHTTSQTKLSLTERKNIRDHVFELKKLESCTDKVIVLIDDVSTTGSTLQACAKALQCGHPKKIFALTLCYTPPHDEES